MRYEARKIIEKASLLGTIMFIVGLWFAKSDFEYYYRGIMFVIFGLIYCLVNNKNPVNR